MGRPPSLLHRVKTPRLLPVKWKGIPRRPPGCPAGSYCSRAAELSLLRGRRGLGSTSCSSSRGASRDPEGGERGGGGRAQRGPQDRDPRLWHRRGSRLAAPTRFPQRPLRSASLCPVGAGRPGGSLAPSDAGTPRRPGTPCRWAFWLVTGPGGLEKLREGAKTPVRGWCPSEGQNPFSSETPPLCGSDVFRNP